MKVTIELIDGSFEFFLEYPDGEIEEFTLTDPDEAAQTAHDLINEMLEVVAGDGTEDNEDV